MLKFDELKDFDVAALGRERRPSTGVPEELPVPYIEVDPDNIRRHCDPALISSLAETIQVDGLLQAIVVRDNPDKPGHYIVSYGERRLRAVRLLGKATIAAVINNEFDPYKQAIENLQREDLHPLDVAEWIARREAQGDSRVEIARRLGKPKSYISELAQLVTAPAEIKQAFRTRKIPDLRTAYLMTRHMTTKPDEVRALLSGDVPVTREAAKVLLADPDSKRDVQDSRPTTALDPRPANSPSAALAVNVDGRIGLMRLSPGKSSKHGVVCFEDGSEKTIPLERMKLQGWALL